MVNILLTIFLGPVSLEKRKAETQKTSPRLRENVVAGKSPKNDSPIVVVSKCYSLANSHPLLFLLKIMILIAQRLNAELSLPETAIAIG